MPEILPQEQTTEAVDAFSPAAQAASQRLSSTVAPRPRVWEPEDADRLLAPAQTDTAEILQRKAALRKSYTPEQITSAMAQMPAQFDVAARLTQDAATAAEIVSGTKPDQETKVRFYAQRLGLDPKFIRENMPLVEDRLALHDSLNVAKNASNVLEWSAKPENMAVARDSLKHLSALESILVSNFGSATQQAGASLNNLARSTLSRFAGAAQSVTDLVGYDTGSKFWREAAEAQLAKATPFTDDVTGFRRFALDALPGMAQIGTSVGISLLTKSPLPMAALFGTMEGGGIYHDLREQEVGMTRALMAAAGVGAINGALEFAQIGSVAKAAGIGEGLGKISTGIVKDVVGGMAENLMQETTQNIASDIGRIVGEGGKPGKEFAPGEITSRLMGSFEQGTYEGVLAAVGSLIFSAPRLYGQLDMLTKSLRQQETLRQAIDLLKKTPVAQRAPEIAAEAVSAITRGQTAAISPLTVETFFQSGKSAENKTRLSAFLQLLNISETRYREALETGAELSVDPGVWLAKVAPTPEGTALFEHLRMNGLHTQAETKLLLDRLGTEAEGLFAALQSTAEMDPKTMPDQWRQLVKDIREKTGLVDAGQVAETARDMLLRLRALAERNNLQLPERLLNARLEVEGQTPSAPAPATQTVDPLALPTESQPWVAEAVTLQENGDVQFQAGPLVEELNKRETTLAALLKCLKG